MGGPVLQLDPSFLLVFIVSVAQTESTFYPFVFFSKGPKRLTFCFWVLWATQLFQLFVYLFVSLSISLHRSLDLYLHQVSPLFVFLFHCLFLCFFLFSFAKLPGFGREPLGNCWLGPVTECSPGYQVNGITQSYLCVYLCV